MVGRRLKEGELKKYRLAGSIARRSRDYGAGRVKEGAQAMNETRQAQADLAFMKALVEEGGRSQMASGASFLAAGLLYGLQCIVQWAQAVGIIHPSDTFMLAFVILITVAFAIVLTIIIWRGRKVGQRAVGVRARR